MPRSGEVSRRTFIRDFGHGLLGISIGGAAFLSACGGDETSSAAARPLDVHRVNLGFVSAYVMVRGTEVAVVDTGTVRDSRSGLSGADEIGQALEEIGLGWSNVGAVVITHAHGDHAGSVHEILNLASDADVGTGGADINSVNERLAQLGVSTPPRPLVTFEDGQMVLGSTIISTPGHTSGHISVWDETTSVLIAGDALFGEPNAGGVEVVEGIGVPTTNADDPTTAIESARKLAALEPETIFFGHGDPKRGGAAAALNALLDEL